MTSFSGGISLSDQGLDLMNKLLNIDPKQVLLENVLLFININISDKIDLNFLYREYQLQMHLSILG